MQFGFESVYSSLPSSLKCSYNKHGQEGGNYYKRDIT